VQGFFGMQFFGLSNDKWSTSKEIWIYFVVTIPVTITAMTIWMFSDSVEFSPLLHLAMPHRKIVEPSTPSSGIHRNPIGSGIDIELVESRQRATSGLI
jgi:hypothetical protein